MDDQLFYYVVFIMGVVGFAGSLYSVMHTGRRLFIHKASLLIEILFIALILYAVPGIGGSYAAPPGKEFGLWVLLPVITYTVAKAISMWVDRLSREMDICKNKEFKKGMKHSGS